MRALEAEVSEIAEWVVQEIRRADRLTDSAPECDFVTDVSARIAIDVIAALLGVPKPDRPQLFRWTNQTIGSADPEFQLGASAQETIRRAREALFAYFADLVEKRRKDPQDDLTNVLVRSRLDGKPLPFPEMASYFLLLVVAGNETTRNATSGAFAIPRR